MMSLTTGKKSNSFHLQLKRPSHPDGSLDNPSSQRQPNPSSKNPSQHYSKHISSTHRDPKPEVQQIYKSARYPHSKKPSIAHIESQQDHDFIHSLGEYISSLNYEARDDIENRPEVEKHLQRYLEVEEKYKKEKTGNGLLAKKIYARRKKIQENNDIILQLEHRINDLIRESQRLKFENNQEEHKNRELKETVVRKQFRREVQGNRAQERAAFELEELEQEKQHFERFLRSNNDLFYS